MKVEAHAHRRIARLYAGLASAHGELADLLDGKPPQQAPKVLPISEEERARIRPAGLRAATRALKRAGYT